MPWLVICREARNQCSVSPVFCLQDQVVVVHWNHNMARVIALLCQLLPGPRLGDLSFVRSNVEPLGPEWNICRRRLSLTRGVCLYTAPSEVSLLATLAVAVGPIHSIGRIPRLWLGTKDTASQHIGKLICFSQRAQCPNALPQGPPRVHRRPENEAYSRWPLQPNEHSNLFPSPQRLSPDN